MRHRATFATLSDDVSPFIEWLCEGCASRLRVREPRRAGAESAASGGEPAARPASR